MTGFIVLRRRRVVERTFAWIMKCRRLVRDYEQLETLITIAAIATLVRRWRACCAGFDPKILPVASACVRRWWLCRAEAARCIGQDRRLDRRDRQAFRYCRGIQGHQSAGPLRGQPGTGGKLSLCFHAVEPDFEVAKWARSSDRSEMQADLPGSVGGTGTCDAIGFQAADDPPDQDVDGVERGIGEVLGTGKVLHQQR